jgi:hypothetical protein
MEIFDGKAMLFLQMLLALQGACHPIDGEADVTGHESSIPASVVHRTTKEEGTLDAWPHYQPTT